MDRTKRPPSWNKTYFWPRLPTGEKSDRHTCHGSVALIAKLYLEVVVCGRVVRLQTIQGVARSGIVTTCPPRSSVYPIPDRYRRLTIAYTDALPVTPGATFLRQIRLT